MGVIISFLNKFKIFLVKDDAQAMVEFVLIFPVVLLLIVGVIEFSLLAVAHLNVNYASFCAARSSLVEKDPHISSALSLLALTNSYIQGISREEVLSKLPDFVKSKVSNIFKNQKDAKYKAAYAYYLTDVETHRTSKEVEAEVVYYYCLKFPVINVLAGWIVKNISHKNISKERGDIFYISSIPHDKWKKAERLTKRTGLRFIPILKKTKLRKL